MELDAAERSSPPGSPLAEPNLWPSGGAARLWEIGQTSLCPMTRARCAALVGRIGSTGYLRGRKILSKRGNECRGCPLDGGRAKIVR